MMGHTHALAGAAGWLALTPLLADHGMRMTPGQTMAGAVVCGGAALLPDLDHHDGTIANAFGPVTRLLCRIVETISGGHRNATHSLPFCALMGLGADLLARRFVPAWWVLLFLIMGLGLHGIGLRIPEREHFNAVLNGLIAAGLTYAVTRMHYAGLGIDLWGYTLGWAGLAVGLGALTHIVTDCLTPEGCPVLWPVPYRVGLPVVPRTDGAVERWVVTPLLTLVIIGVGAWSAFGVTIPHWFRPSG